MSLPGVVTDLDSLIALGYSPIAAKCALKSARGNRDEAAQMLRRQLNQSDSNEHAWRGTGDDDWLSYGPSNASTTLPQEAESRALLKSPIYARVGSYRKLSDKNDDIVYSIKVVLKDRRTWEIERGYQDFFNLYLKLPLSTHNSFTNHFPQPKLFVLGDGYLERRLVKLQEWLRELVMNESLMTNAGVLHTLYAFLNAQDHGGPVSVERTQQGLLANHNFLPPGSFQFTMNTKTVPAIEVQEPVPLSVFVKSLPIKYDIGKILGGKDAPFYADPFLSSDMSEKQLGKDYKRDRLIINGKRIVGSVVTIEQIIDVCIHAINNAAQQTLRIKDINWEGEDLRKFVIECLRSLGRTDSAFKCHELLGRVIDLSVETAGVVVVPESTLATPIELAFSIKERETSSRSSIRAVKPSPSTSTDMPSYAPPPPPPPPVPGSSLAASNTFSSVAAAPASIDWNPKPTTLDWCIVFEGQASMVFRFCDMETMKAHLQIQTCFRKVLYGMPGRYPSSPEKTYLESKAGSETVYVEKDLRTSSRDWS